MQQSDEALAPHTNQEYIEPVTAAREPAVLKTVFHAVVVDTIKDFFSSIFGFFLRYVRHFFRSFLFFLSPSLRKKPFDELDYKENCQHAFELALLVLFAIIFAVKLDWIPQTSDEVLDLLNNDLSQMAFQFVLFLIFAFAYFLLGSISLLLGRAARRLFKLQMTRRECDILSIYLNNAFFSITSIIGLVIRCITSSQITDPEMIGNGLIVIFLPLCLCLILVWAIRFIVLHRLGFVKGLIFFILAVPFYTVLFGIGEGFTSVFFMAI